MLTRPGEFCQHRSSDRAGRMRSLRGILVDRDRLQLPRWIVGCLNCLYRSSIDSKDSPFTQRALISSLRTIPKKQALNTLTVQATPSAQGQPQLPLPRESQKQPYKHSGDGVMTRTNDTFGCFIANWPAFHPSSSKSDSKLEVAIQGFGKLLVRP